MKVKDGTVSPRLCKIWHYRPLTLRSTANCLCEPLRASLSDRALKAYIPTAPVEIVESLSATRLFMLFYFKNCKDITYLNNCVMNNINILTVISMWPPITVHFLGQKGTYNIVAAVLFSICDLTDTRLPNDMGG